MYSNERKNNILWVFLIISLILDILGLSNRWSSFYFQKPLFLIHYRIDLLFTSAFVIFSIYCLYRFKRDKLAKITFVIPIWHIVVYLISVLIGLILVPLNLKFGITPNQVFSSSVFTAINDLLGILGTLFNIYLIFIIWKK
jgi:hypothetical protein